jgi:hypothetical protein
MIMLEGTQLDYEDALDNALVIKRLTGGKQVLKLIDARNGFSMDKKARDYIKSMDLKQTVSRAVVVNSDLNKLIANFFTRLSKPKVPTRLFTDIDSAYEWLLQFKAKNL